MNWTEKLENKVFYSKQSRMRPMLPFKKLHYLCRCCIQSHQNWKKEMFFWFWSPELPVLCILFKDYKTWWFYNNLPKGMPEPWSLKKFATEQQIIKLKSYLYWLSRKRSEQDLHLSSIYCCSFSLKVFLGFHKSKLIHFIMFITHRNFK